jgi:hypothetical protein
MNSQIKFAKPCMISHKVESAQKYPGRLVEEQIWKLNARNPLENWNVSSFIFHSNDNEASKKKMEFEFEIVSSIRFFFDALACRATLRQQIINGSANSQSLRGFSVARSLFRLICETSKAKLQFELLSTVFLFSCLPENQKNFLFARNFMMSLICFFVERLWYQISSELWDPFQ